MSRSLGARLQHHLSELIVCFTLSGELRRAILEERRNIVPDSCDVDLQKRARSPRSLAKRTVYRAGYHRGLLRQRILEFSAARPSSVDLCKRVQLYDRARNLETEL